MLTSSEGKSDPYVVFTLNNQKVFKSQTKKKTLTPEWNESFAVQVVSLLAETKALLYGLLPFANAHNAAFPSSCRLLARSL